MKNDIKLWLLDLVEECPISIEILMRNESDFGDALNKARISASEEGVVDAFQELLQIGAISVQGAHSDSSLDSQLLSNSSIQQLFHAPVNTTFYQLTPLGGGKWLAGSGVDPLSLMWVELPIDESACNPEILIYAFHVEAIQGMVDVLKTCDFVQNTSTQEQWGGNFRYWFRPARIIECKIIGNFSMEVLSAEYHESYMRFWGLYTAYRKQLEIRNDI